MAEIYETADAFRAASPSGPLVGLDLGEKTVGLAVCDPARAIATPLETLRRTKFSSDADRIEATARERGAAAAVLGLPLNMDGTEGPRAQSTRAFARNLVRRGVLSVFLWDERLSTAAMERELIALDTSRAKRAQVIDAMAASYILQGAIDRLRRIGEA
ncbi:MAG: Holliday junction resolvase RuvX [Pseudomonadota bacterium]